VILKLRWESILISGCSPGSPHNTVIPGSRICVVQAGPEDPGVGWCTGWIHSILSWAPLRWISHDRLRGPQRQFLLHVTQKSGTAYSVSLSRVYPRRGGVHTIARSSLTLVSEDCLHSGAFSQLVDRTWRVAILYNFSLLSSSLRFPPSISRFCLDRQIPRDLQSAVISRPTNIRDIVAAWIAAHPPTF
jgi:hypothetical protein